VGSGRGSGGCTESSEAGCSAHAAEPDAAGTGAADEEGSVGQVDDAEGGAEAAKFADGADGGGSAADETSTGTAEEDAAMGAGAEGAGAEPARRCWAKKSLAFWRHRMPGFT
jgi:hypothetical protein